MILICIILAVLYFKLRREGFMSSQSIAQIISRVRSNINSDAAVEKVVPLNSDAAVEKVAVPLNSDAVVEKAAVPLNSDAVVEKAVPCEKDEVGCIETVINPQRSMVYNLSYTPPYDCYSKTSIDSSYNNPYYKENTFDVDIMVVQSDLKNVYPISASYTYCNWEQGKPSCVFTTRGVSQADHNARIGDWLNEKQLIPKQETAAKLYAERKRKSDDLALLENNTKKYMDSI